MSSINYTNTIAQNGTITISGQSGMLYSNGTRIYSPKQTYNVLGKEIEVEGYQDFNLSLILSLINTLGIRFYIETKKNNINLPIEIENILEEELISYSRNETIEKIIKEE